MSRDLTPPDLFIWGLLRGKFYTKKPYTINNSKGNIHQETAAISAGTLQSIFARLEHRLQMCIDNGGDHFKHII
jgi:hypothetical protein